MLAIWFVWMGAVATPRRALTGCESPTEEVGIAMEANICEALYLDPVATTYSLPVPSGFRAAYLPPIATEHSRVSHPSMRHCLSQLTFTRVLQACQRLV
jgi:hypothetical protein